MKSSNNIMPAVNTLDETQLCKIKGKSQSRVSRPSHECICIARQNTPYRSTVSFCNEIWKALKAPQYVECYWYGDDLVLVSSISGYLVAMNNTVKNRDRNSFNGRIHLRSMDLFEAIASKWKLSDEIGYLYSGGRFVKANCQGKPAVIISRTADDYYRNEDESAGE